MYIFMVRVRVKHPRVRVRIRHKIIKFYSGD